MKLEPIIGLEIHVQLKTASKLFCPCDNRGELLPPNTAICPICVGHPGTLPVPNQRAVEFGVLLGLTLNCTIARHLTFDRKHYFYPDLPKGYQISQSDNALCTDGFFEFDVPGAHVPRGHVRIGIERSHLEEDAAKSFHQDGETLVDFNRGGTPLMETVTRPDFKTPHEARIFLQELRALVRALGISEGDMEKGHLRCDANISLRPVGEETLCPKTEIKNINSFRSVERALEYEIKRQTELWEADSPPDHQSTRNWDDVAQRTTESRTKEAAHDYRFFPEPDIPPFDLAELTATMREKIPELPAARRERFMREYGFSAPDARQLVDDDALASYAEHVMSEFFDWARTAAPDISEDELRTRAAKLISGWLLSKYLGILNDLGRLFTPTIVTPENFAEFLTLIQQNKMNSSLAQRVLREMVEHGADPSHVLEQMVGGDTAPTVEVAVQEVIATFPDQVAQYRAGKTAVLQFLVGQVMKKTKGVADPKTIADTFNQLL